MDGWMDGFDDAQQRSQSLLFGFVLVLNSGIRWNQSTLAYLPRSFCFWRRPRSPLQTCSRTAKRALTCHFHPERPRRCCCRSRHPLVASVDAVDAAAAAGTKKTAAAVTAAVVAVAATAAAAAVTTTKTAAAESVAVVAAAAGSAGRPCVGLKSSASVDDRMIRRMIRMMTSSIMHAAPRLRREKEEEQHSSVPVWLSMRVLRFSRTAAAVNK